MVRGVAWGMRARGLMWGLTLMYGVCTGGETPIEIWGWGWEWVSGSLCNVRQSIVAWRLGAGRVYSISVYTAVTIPLTLFATIICIGGKSCMGDGETWCVAQYQWCSTKVKCGLTGRHVFRMQRCNPHKYVAVMIWSLELVVLATPRRVVSGDTARRLLVVRVMSSRGSSACCVCSGVGWRGHTRYSACVAGCMHSLLDGVYMWQGSYAVSVFSLQCTLFAGYARASTGGMSESCWGSGGSCTQRSLVGWCTVVE